MIKKALKSAWIATFLMLPSLVWGIEYDVNFNPNQIVSDYLMYNSTNSMSLSEIQSFLESKNSYLARYQTEDAEGVIKSAAEIIYDAAQTYQINPQGIIVLLQKEQGLITKEAANQKRLDWATGYAVCDGCHLNSPKVKKYKGFGKQVDNGAGALRFYKENMDRYGFIKNIGQPYEISKELVIPENAATASLYTYTPHILGNYNYWRIWQRYFGNPLAQSPLELDATVQTKYMAQILDSAAPKLKAKEGEQAWYWVEFTNIGTETWTNFDKESLFLLNTKKKDLLPLISEDSTYDQIAFAASIDKNDRILSEKTSVAPGEVLRFAIPIEPNYQKTEQAEYVLVIGGKGWLPGAQVSYELTRQFNYDAELIDDTMPEFSEEHTTHRLKVAYKNVGNNSWTADDVYLDWDDQTKGIRAKIPMDQEVVKPGQTATFSLITKIKAADIYKYNLELVKKVAKDSFNRFPTGKHTPTITVRNGLAAQVLDLQVPNEMKPGQEYTAWIKVKNVGGVTWTPNDLVLRSYGKISPFTRSSFYNKDWHSGFAIEKISKQIAPGETHTMMFKITAPKKAGTYKQYYQLEWGKKYTEIVMDDNDYHKLVTTKVAGSLARN